jgi:acyl-coenzyme A synthetase/AMP-(fatty) acid ligase
VKSKPDFVLVLVAVFAIGVVVTLMLPTSASQSVAAPASQLQAGVLPAD